MTCRIVRSTHNWSFIFALSFLAIIFANSSKALGVDTWTDGTGNWSTAGNWSTGVPTSGPVAISNSDAVNRTITYDYSGSPVTLGQLNINNSGGGTDTLSMPGHTLTTTGLSIGGVSATTGGGAMVQNGGTFNENGDADIAGLVGSIGSYSINNTGTMFTIGGGNSLHVGDNGIGTFTENGGSVSVAAWLLLGQQPNAIGTYSLTSGSLSVGQNEYIGDAATGNSSVSGGTFNQSGGSNTLTASGHFWVGYGTAGTGTYNLSGGTLSGSPTEVVGGSDDGAGGIGLGTGTFNQTGGSNSTGELDVGQQAGAKGTYTITAGTLSPTSGIIVGGASSHAGGAGVLNIGGSGTINTSSLEIYNTSGTSVNLNGGNLSVISLNFNGVPSLFHWTSGTLSILTSLVFDAGASPTSTSTAFGNSLTLGTLQTLAINGGNETLGGNSAFALTVGTGASNSVFNTLTVNAGSQLYLSGGTLSVNNLIVNGLFSWTTGTLNINGSQTTTIGASGPFGSVFTLGSGQNLNLFNSMTVNAGSLLTINGGNLTGYSMINNGNASVNSGGLNFYTLFNQAGSSFVIGPSALAYIQGPASNAGEIELGGSNATLYNEQGYSINNTGLIHGDGVIAMNVSNSTGEIRAEDGKRLKITGSLGTSYGKINLQGGVLELSSPLTNGAGSGQIEGRGTLIVGGTGLTNNGNIAFSAGISDVFGDVHNSTGSASQGITISGNANVTFWDDVTNGTSTSDPTLFKVSSGSVATFFGTYSGNGVSGTGSVYYEADVSPGFSPASVNYGGSVTLDSTSDLKIELGGRTVGTQYDKVNVAGQLSLDGALNVVLINSFKPKAGDTFDILDWNSLSGTFAGGVNLPALGGRIVWNSSQLYTTGTLSVVATYYAGDFNRDGVVTVADIQPMMQALTNLSSYEATYGALSPAQALLLGDLNGDGQFTNADIESLIVTIANGSSGSGTITAVPEPATLTLGVLGVLVLVGHNASQRRSRWCNSNWIRPMSNSSESISSNSSALRRAEIRHRF